jgi:hypothetical protein
MRLLYFLLGLLLGLATFINAAPVSDDDHNHLQLLNVTLSGMNFTGDHCLWYTQYPISILTVVSPGLRPIRRLPQLLYRTSLDW